jgi:hypothetical protein
MMVCYYYATEDRNARATNLMAAPWLPNGDAGNDCPAQAEWHGRLSRAVSARGTVTTRRQKPTVALTQSLAKEAARLNIT